MRDCPWQIGLFGTFDVENYGDLLFPLIAEAELTRRLGPVNLHRFSYRAKTPPDWPYTVTSLSELPERIGRLDAVLIGGGFLIRFDKDVAPDYYPPTDTIHHPTGYWLTPALIALQYGVPLIWNAPGMHCNDIPEWAHPLVELALTLSPYIAVRDEPSRAALSRFVENDEIAVVPDTAFGVGRFFNGEPSDQLKGLREECGLTGPYIIVQPCSKVDAFSEFVREHWRHFEGFQFLVLPIGPVLGDDASAIRTKLAEAVCLPAWPQPLLLAELISQAAAVVGYSYHLAITALTFGVPVFTPADLAVGKYSALSAFDGVYALPTECETEPEQFIALARKTAPCAAVGVALDKLAAHWDRVAARISAGRTAAPPAIGRFWQTLPGMLEAGERRLDAVVRESQAEAAEKQRRIDELSRLLELSRVEITARDDRAIALLNSPSWRITAPLRSVMRYLKRLSRNGRNE
ncbi:MAG TPA: polysaccharide pyruvyl transferase family protein [Blastocatellia bacterium]|nr:polysaccharide pyruvyl transferase family protein [Blastocatellia bacterium]